ncbi:MAG: hypothetical protein Q8O30_01070 [Candidatus Omnitrophota bacterium]|nr:hypothetical protein [Candidatus Omnitrophota bacterium]
MTTGEFEKIVGQLCQVFKKHIGKNIGRIRFRYNGKANHLVLVCHNGKIIQIVAKDDKCRKGECLPWADSEFSILSPEETFFKFFDKISKIVINEPQLEKSWDSFNDFLNWLNTMSQ